MLDDDDGIAHVAASVRALRSRLSICRADAGRCSVHQGDVQHADEAAADLASEANQLRFAAGQGRGATVEREVVQADIEQETKSATQFLEHLLGNGALQRREALFQWSCLRIDPGREIADRQGAHFDQRLAADAHGSRLRIEALALAFGACCKTRMYFSSCKRRGPAAVFLKLLSNCGTMPSHFSPCFQTPPPRCFHSKVMCLSPLPCSNQFAAAPAAAPATAFSSRCRAFSPRLRRYACASGPCRAERRRSEWRRCKS